MPKALFNGDCCKCHIHRPRCAKVYLRVDGKATQYHKEPTVMCDCCRREMNGQYRIHEDHR